MKRIFLVVIRARGFFDNRMQERDLEALGEAL